jgi:hypothetical protein
VTNLQKFNFSYLAEDGSLRLSKTLLVWFLFLAKPLLLFIGAITSSVNENALLSYFFPVKQNLILGIVFSLVALALLQIYVFAKSMPQKWQHRSLRYFKVVSLVMVGFDVALTLIIFMPYVDWPVTALFMFGDVAMAWFIVNNDYLSFYIRYYLNNENAELNAGKSDSSHTRKD